MADVELVELEPQPVAVVRGHVTVDGIPSFLGEAYDEVIRTHSRKATNPPVRRSGVMSGQIVGSWSSPAS